MKKYLIGLLLLTLLGLSVQAKTRNCTIEEQQQADQLLLSVQSNEQIRYLLISEHLPFGLPEEDQPSNSEKLLVNRGYIEMYDEELGTSLWAAYHLTKTDLVNARGKERVNCFRSDPRIAGGPSPKDYQEPIYDQGHIINDASLKDELIEELNTYVMSNMSPMTCETNRGIFATAENQVRNWALKYGDIYIVSGSIFDRNGDKVRDANSAAIRMLSNDGNRRVAVPNAFFKLIYRELSNGQYAVLAFTFENNHVKHGSKWSLTKTYMQSREVSLAELENLTDTHFFRGIDYVNLTEDRSLWSWKKAARNMEYTCK